MLDDLVGSLLGQLLPFDIGESSRLRRYKKGGRVVFPGRVEGVRGIPYSDYLVAQAGQLWVSNRRRDGDLVAVPPPLPQASVEVFKGTLKDSFHLSYESQQGPVKVYPWMNRLLVERVLEDARKRGIADPTEDEIFDSPEAAALVDYPPSARARVVKVRYKRRGKEAIVEITTDPDYPYFVHVERTASGWVPTLGHN